ncbi:MAG: PAS domain-containing sensor histidine kinase, partial [Gemmatimonadales bacterium]
MKPAPYERQITRLALLGGAPAVIVALWLTWSGELSLRAEATISLFILVPLFGYAWALHERVVRPLQTVSNMLAALRELDYSLR